MPYLNLNLQAVAEVLLERAPESPLHSVRSDESRSPLSISSHRASRALTLWERQPCLAPPCPCEWSAQKLQAAAPTLAPSFDGESARAKKSKAACLSASH